MVDREAILVVYEAYFEAFMEAQVHASFAENFIDDVQEDDSNETALLDSQTITAVSSSLLDSVLRNIVLESIQETADRCFIHEEDALITAGSVLDGVVRAELGCMIAEVMSKEGPEKNGNKRRNSKPPVSPHA